MTFNPRLTRLQDDHRRLTALAQSNRSIEILRIVGNPPEQYTLKLRCKGIARLDGRSRPQYAYEHQLRIVLSKEYPRNPPGFFMLTPIWHPNIGSSNTEALVCIGDLGNHGYAPSMRLDDLVLRIMQMIRYENYGVDRPLNGLAAEWAKQNKALFPLEKS